MERNIYDMTFDQLTSHCRAAACSPLHAKNIFRQTYKRLVRRPWESAGLPHEYAKQCGDFFNDHRPTIVVEYISQYDQSVKFVIALHDNKQVEMVLMPEKKRITLCVSSQVGCAQGCTFCHTGRMGLVRNLSAAEIVSQVVLAQTWIINHPDWLNNNHLTTLQGVTNIVFMGMGEPLDNVASVADSISILTNPYGLNIAMRRISVSTAGHLDGLQQLISIHPDARIAISLHSPFDHERSKIMPINRRWSLHHLIDRLHSMPNQQKHGLLIQYTLIRNVNDSMEHAQALVALLGDLKVKVNLIPLNPVGPSRMQGPDEDRVMRFRNEIHKSGLRVMVRYSKGQDIAGACGQLVTQ